MVYEELDRVFCLREEVVEAVLRREEVRWKSPARCRLQWSGRFLAFKTSRVPPNKD
jgi:hypothetical protein